MEVVLQWLANRPAALDGFIGGIFSSIIVVWVYDHWMVVRRVHDDGTTNPHPR